MREKVSIVPDTSLLPKLGKSGYSTAQAIAELVDNSIDAVDSNKSVGQVYVTVQKSFIKVFDNGSGMNKEELTNSLKLAKSNKQSKLGRFGLGLKTASLSLGSRFNIITKSDDEDFIYTVDYDENQWEKHKDWSIEIDSTKNSVSPSFTEVKIEGLKNKIPLNTLDKIKIDISQRYAPYIQNHEVEIFVNKDRCMPLKPILLEGTKRDINIPVIWQGKNVGEIKGWVALLKEGSNKGNYGFTTYWLNRMITTFDKIAIGEHPTISRIIGELHLDFLEPTHNKREFIRESPLYEYTVKLLKKDLQDILTEARKKANKDTITPKIQNNIQKYAEATLEVLNTDDFFKEFTTKVAKDKLNRDDTGDIRDKVNVEQRNKEGINDLNEVKEKEKFRDLREPQKVHKSLRRGIKIKGKYFKFVHSFKNLGKEEGMKIVARNKGTIEIYTNIDFPSYQVTKDKAYYAYMNVADYIAELYCSEVDGSNYFEIRETILRKVADYIAEIEK